MTKKARADKRPAHEAWDAAASDDARNRLLLLWLSDDKDREALFRLVNGHYGGVFLFPSRYTCPPPSDLPCDQPLAAPQTGHRTVELVTNRQRIHAGLIDDGSAYSHRPYGDIGGGNFMLAIDVATAEGKAAHAAQLKALCHGFPRSAELLRRVSEHACRSAAIVALSQANFDLAAFAEQTALRFCQSLYGYALSDYRQLEAASRAAYRALVHQALGRHFVSDPTVLPAAKLEMARLLSRTSSLIEAYASKDTEALKGCEASVELEGLDSERVMLKLARDTGTLNGEQRAVITVGAVTGTVGNVQAAVCIAVRHFFSDEDLWAQARKLAMPRPGTVPAETPDQRAQREKQEEGRWRAWIGEALRLNPPIPYLPRLTPGASAREVVLALGGDTNVTHGSTVDDSWIWGLAPGEECNAASYGSGSNDAAKGSHWCIGRVLAWPLILAAVRYVMGLPGLSQRVDPVDGSIMELERRWGFACERYPLTHRRDRRVMQRSLNVAMRIKAPHGENAERLREVIRAGAPRIDEALRRSRHVHFAWFEFIEHDTVLVLHTVYDGDFSAYIKHFATSVGHLFDKLFEWIEDAPPLPVDENPYEFVAHIKRYDRPPAMGYFFSAYPQLDAARILRSAKGRA